MAFQQGLSGLATASKALDAISNNVSNSGTVGYKQSNAQFADVFAASLVGGSSQVGIGASVGSVSQQFTQGNINTSGNPLDLAINGQGFFAMAAADAQTPTYSRNGQFKTDQFGYIVNAQGLRLQGYNIDPVSKKLLSTISPLQLNIKQSDPKSTTAAGYGLNFDSRSATPSALTATSVIGGAMTFPAAPASLTIPAGAALTLAVDGDPAVTVSLDPAKGNYTDPASVATALQSAFDASSLKGRVKVTADPNTNQLTLTSVRTGRSSNINITADTSGVLNLVPTTPGTVGSNDNFNINDPLSYTSSTSQTVYDEQGIGHTQSLYFVKTAVPNTWDVYCSLDGIPPSPLGTSTDRRMATLTFDSSGVFSNVSTPTVDAAGVVTWATSLVPKVTTPAFPVSTGIGKTLQFTVDFTGSTQFGSGYSVNQLSQDGYTTGQLSGVSISSDGSIEGNFTNGRSELMGQVALVNFKNPNGLRSLGGNQWEATASAGSPTTGQPGTGVLGVIQSGAVEESNVDLTAELVNMITQQRAYQANAQSIKTEDQILQTLVNLR